jgi:hypothetical protein
VTTKSSFSDVHLHIVGASPLFLSVMPGLVSSASWKEDVDGRDKPGHDDLSFVLVVHVALILAKPIT